MSCRTCLRNLAASSVTEWCWAAFLLFLLPAASCVSNTVHVEFWNSARVGSSSLWEPWPGSHLGQVGLTWEWRTSKHFFLPDWAALTIQSQCSSVWWSLTAVLHLLGNQKDNYGEAFEFVKHRESKEMLSQCEIILFLKALFVQICLISGVV